MSRGITRSFGAAGRAALGFIGVVGAAGAAGAFLKLVDASKQVEAQLRLATRESGTFAQAQEDVRRISSETRTGLQETAQLYATFQRTALQLGITQEQSARATETVTKAFRISGATAAEASGGLRQFLQGLQSGALRGEELNSVLENAPRLAKLLADSLGVTVGQLRLMGQEGDLAANKLISALTDRKFTASIDAEFRELPVTFDQAMTQVYNAALITFGAFDRGGQFSTALATFITDGTDGFAELEQTAVETGIDIRSTFEGLANVFDPMLDAAKNIFGSIETEAMTLADRIRPLLSDIDTILNFQPGELGNFERWIDRNVWGIGPSNLAGRFDEGVARSEARLRADLAAQAASGAQPGVPTGPRPSGVAPASTAAANRAAAAARKAEAERLAAIREDAAKQEEVARLQDDILAARTALARAAEDVLKFELQQIDSEKAQRLAQYQTEVKLGDLTDQEYRDRAALVEQETQLRKEALLLAKAERDVEKAQERERALLREQHDQLALEADTLATRAYIADTLEKRRFLEESALAIQQQIERELLEQAIAEGRVTDAAEARRRLAERQSAEMSAQRKANQGPLGRYLDSTADPRTLAEEAAVRELQNVRDGLAEGLAEELGIENDFVKDMLAIFLDQNIFRPIAEALRNASSGGGGIGGLISSIGAALLGGGGKSLGNKVKGFAGGGAMVIGGLGGTDNNLLSLNGQPLARVSRGETLNISPNEQLRAGAGAGGVVKLVIEEAPGFAARVRTEAAGVAIEVQRQTAPAMIDAAANETFRRAGRPGL